MLKPDETARHMLSWDTKCEEAEDRLRALLVELERDGIAPKLIAGSLARVLLGFCAEHARKIENYGWVVTKLTAQSDLLQLQQSEADYRSWVRRFLKRQHRLYNEARFQIRADTTPPPLPPFAIDAATPQGRA